MADAADSTLWLVSGAASLVFLGWALLELVRIRRTGNNATRRWFLVFLLTMVALVLAGVAQANLDGAGDVLVGLCFAFAGVAFFKAARSQRRLLEGSATQEADRVA